MPFCSFFAVHMFSEAHFTCRNFTWSQEETDLEAHSCNPSVLETEARGHLVQGQPGLPSWAWLQKHKYKTTYVSRAQLDKHNPIYTHLCIATSTYQIYQLRQNHGTVSMSHFLLFQSLPYPYKTDIH